MWNIILVVLIIGNLIYFFPLLQSLFYLATGGQIADLGWLIMFGPYILGVSLVNFLVLLVYAVTNNPQGWAKVISFTALAINALMLFAAVFATINNFVFPFAYHVKLFFIQ